MHNNIKVNLKSNLNSKNIFSSSIVHHSNNIFCTYAKGDSGATNHYFTQKDAKYLSNLQSTTMGPTVQLPNADCISTTAKGTLPLKAKLPASATTTYVLPQLQTSLISLGQLADAGCHICLDKNTLKVFRNFKRILTGHRNKSDGLWDIPLLPQNGNVTKTFSPYLHKSNVIIPKRTNISTLLQYMHASLFSPTKSTLLKAIHNGNFIGWPGLTTNNVSKFLHETTATALGHMDQERQGLQSTKSPHYQHDCFFPTKANKPTNEIIATIIDFKKAHTAYFDLMGAFPYISSRGNQYILLLYDYDSNAITVKAMKTRQGAEITRT